MWTSPVRRIGALTPEFRTEFKRRFLESGNFSQSSARLPLGTRLQTEGRALVDEARLLLEFLARFVLSASPHLWLKTCSPFRIMLTLAFDFFKFDPNLEDAAHTTAQPEFVDRNSSKKEIWL